MSTKSNFLFDFLIGGVSASIGKTATAPIERVKLIIQNQKVIEVVNIKYKGMIDCFSQLIKKEGIISLWRGNVINLMRYFPTQAFNFAFKDTFKKLFSNNPIKNFNKFVMGNFLAGGLAGALSMFILYPLDFGRTRLAVDNKNTEGNRRFTGSLSCFMQILKKEGFTGIYKGFSIAVIEMFFYRGIYFGGYDTLKYLYFKKGTKIWFKWSVAQAVTLFSALCVYPMDTVKRRLMIMSGEEKKQYNNVKSCFIDIYKSETFLGFYKGFGINALRIFGASIILILYDEIQGIFGITARGGH